MMRTSVRSSVRILVLLLLASAIGRGQSPQPSTSVGIIGGFDAGAVRATFPIYDGSAECGIFDGGRLFGGRLGAALDLPSLFSSDIGLSGSLAGVIRFDRFTVPLPSLLLFDAELKHGVSVAHEERYAVQERGLQLDLFGSWRIGGILRLKAGPWAEYRFFTFASQVDAITDPTYRFPGGALEMANGAGSRLTPATLGGGIAAAIDYVGGRDGGWSIVPGLIARTDLLSDRAGISWKTTTLGLEIGLYYSRPPADVHDDIPLPPAHIDSTATAPVAVLPRMTGLTASLHLYGIDSAGAALPSVVVSVREVVWNDDLPIDPVLRFDRHGRIDDEDFVPLEAERQTTFAPDSLAGGNSGEYARHTLDLIGFRMRSNPSSTFLLRVASGAPDEPPIAVRSYLNRIWGIDTMRISISRSSVVASQTIELLGTPASLTAPVTAERIDRRLDPPMIALDPVYSSPAGIRRWEIALRHGGEVLGHVASDGKGARELRWRIAGDDTLLAPLVAELTVEDSAGEIATARDQAPLTLRKTVANVTRTMLSKEGGEFLQVTLFREKPGSREPGADNIDLLRRIAAMIRSGARITIVPPDEDAASRELAGNVLTRLRELLGTAAARTTRIVVAGGNERGEGACRLIVQRPAR